MATHPAANSVNLKNTILKGVYDQNLKIENDRYEPSKKGISRRRKPVSRIIILVFFAAVLFGVQQVQTGNIAIDEIDPVTVAPATAEEVGPTEPLPAFEAEASDSESVSFFPIPKQFSYVMGLIDVSPSVELNADQLLDYGLMLNNEEVRLSSVFGLDVRTIIIDPGHGGKDPGAIGAFGTMEKDIVLDIAKGLKDNLETSGRYNVILTRDEDKTMSLSERVDFANAADADLFISLHVNALPQKSFNVTETYYYGPPSDPKTLKLAEQENKGSGISTKEFENMIQKISNTFKEQESANLAMAIQHSLFTNVKKYDKDITDAGIKMAPLVVLLGVNAPSVLVEISCITKKEEELKLNMLAYREEITTFLTQGTIRYLNRRNLHVFEGEENGRKDRKKSS
ncbi:MAG: N-acetylmuramoyl-L-alanine amidase [Deltaproteobacteria bacterium]|nr:N-acetylmuramoyl-L-alanine amidase [Deltaproteobacteria bacterium]